MNIHKNLTQNTCHIELIRSCLPAASSQDSENLHFRENTKILKPGMICASLWGAGVRRKSPGPKQQEQLAFIKNLLSGIILTIVLVLFHKPNSKYLRYIWLFSSFYRCLVRSKRLNNLPKVTRLGTSWVEIWSQTIWAPEELFIHFCMQSTHNK